MKSGVKVTNGDYKKALKSLSFIMQHHVVVGIPQSANHRKQNDEMSNADIGYTNEFGSPAKNIPPRPHLVPAVDGIEKRTTELLKRAAKLALKNKNDEALKSLEAVGTIAVNAVKQYITNHEFQPLSSTTLHRRKTRKVAKRQGKKPLIDTGEYRRSITYEVRENAT